MTGVVIKVDASEAFAGLDRIYAAAGRPQAMLKAIGEYGAESTKERIRSEVTPEGAAFAPLNPLYALTKRGPGILREKGTLAQIVWRLAGGDAVEWGSNAIYAAAHQFGALIKPLKAAALAFSLGGNNRVAVKSVTIPARPYLGLSAQDKVRIMEIAQDFLGAAADGKTP